MIHLTRLFGNFVKLVILTLVASTLYAQEASQSELDEQVNVLSAQVDDLSRNIALLEQELLFPPLTRVQVYLSMTPDSTFRLRSMMVKIDGVEKSYHIYSDSDLAALRLGGIQRFWEGNVSLGVHSVDAEFKGTDAKGNKYSQNVTFNFEKTLSGHSVELAVGSTEDSLMPSFTVKDWGEKR
ncbi:Uncharacterised protein [BD1-7 clade bacterium]|uniref:AraC family transcriptional regulator n=1 Tax=BD1-7 clade bacterium TaxID=2029982 RepID=A0A5S9NRS6_9GAMM|nr:Uncharacterised protein [BD1-7 clade bacterium]CAA0093312.1 Uncharacterised protein [BD1-7 clade bacterium]